LTDKTLASKFLLITADTDVRIRDASTEWHDKFVFFSPKITFGVDFSINTPQDMFIYVRGKSITPAGIFQQATRTRNISTLYYHGEGGNDDSIYDSLEDVSQNIEACVTTSKALLSTCTYVDELDEIHFSRNTFFKLFCYNEFVNDAFASNKVKHFERFLLQNGFSLATRGQPRKLSMEERQHQRDLVDQISEELFEEFCKPTTDRLQPKFAQLYRHICYLVLNPNDHDTLRKYQQTLVNKYRVEEHDDILRLLKTAQHVNDELESLNQKSIDAKLLSNRFQKAKLINEFGTKYGLTLLTLNAQEPVPGTPCGDGDVQMDDAFFALVKQAFRVTRAKPKTFREIKQLFVSIVRSATCKNLITSKQGKAKSERDVTLYSLNEGLVKHHLELSSFKNKRRKGFAPEVVEKFGLQATEEADLFLD